MPDTAKPTIDQYLGYWALKIFGRLITLLPLGLANNIGCMIGIALSVFFPIRRKIIHENLDIAFGSSISKKERARLTREAYKSLMMLTIESMYLQHKSNDWALERVVEVHGMEHVQAFRESQTPWIAVTGHLGDWEILGAWVSTKLCSMATLAKPIHNPLMQAQVASMRERHGLRMLWTGGNNVPRQILQALKDGFSVNFLADQDMRTEGIFPPFFGRPASTTPAPALFAIKQGIPLVPFFIIRLGPTRHRVVLCPPIWPHDFPSENRDEQIMLIMTKFNSVLEDMVRLHPAQYFWMHRRWKTTEKAARRWKKSLAKKRKRAREREQDAKDSP